jgi:hypothetical protein
VATVTRHLCRLGCAPGVFTIYRTERTKLLVEITYSIDKKIDKNRGRQRSHLERHRQIGNIALCE